MINTKHDLSADIAKLNLNELIKVAQIAVGRSRWDCEQALSKLQANQLYSNPNKCDRTYQIASAAKDLAEASRDLAEATNTLHYLLNAEDREKIAVDRR